MIKIGIDPSGTGTTGIVVFEDNKLIEKYDFTNKNWKEHFKFTDKILFEKTPYNVEEVGAPQVFINIEDCLYTSANASKDRDDLLRLLGALEISGFFDKIISPRYTKSVVKNIENLSKYNDNCIWKYEKNNNLIL